MYFVLKGENSVVSKNVVQEIKNTPDFIPH